MEADAKLASWAVADILQRGGVRAVFFTGEEGQKRRTQNLVDFHDDPAVRVLFASDAGGVGLNLQRAASCCITLEIPWNPAVLEQRIGRIYRLGQTRPIEVYHLAANAGIEARIAGLVGDKKALFTGLFDGTSDEVQFDRSGTFLSRIEKIVQPVVVPALSEQTEDPAPDSTEGGAELTDLVPPAQPTVEAPSAHQSSWGLPEYASAKKVRELFSTIEVRPARNGRIILNAPSEAVATLAALFEGMAKMLSASAQNAGER